MDASPAILTPSGCHGSAQAAASSALLGMDGGDGKRMTGCTIGSACGAVSAPRCHRTLTALPGWCVPVGRYSLMARREAVGSLGAGQSLEQAAPECHDPDRVADAATVRRWAWRRFESLVVGAALAWNLFSAPTLLAWDFRVALGILTSEPAPP